MREGLGRAHRVDPVAARGHSMGPADRAGLVDPAISRDEAANHARLSQSFDRIDTDKDGALSQDELRAARPHGKHGHHARVDANQDGTISRDEAKNAPRLAENFEAIDANKDGMLSRDELDA